MIYNLSHKDLNRNIYRIISLDRLHALFQSNVNTLVKPIQWEDTFENFILKSKIRNSSGEIDTYDFHSMIYGQCWTLDKASDAMWRIYSPDRTGVRIRTTIGKLLEGLCAANPHHTGAKCCIGKVRYLRKQKLMKVANSTFADNGISVDSLFQSLLIKRREFKYESEVRILYHELDLVKSKRDIYQYPIDPHALIDQIMLDPRIPYKEFRMLKSGIINSTEFQGAILRSKLYTLPNDIVLEAWGD